MDTSIDNKSKYQALAFTIGFHVLLFLLFIFMVFVTPIPPFEIKPVPEIELGLGMEGKGNSDAGGSGQNDKDITTTSDTKVKNASVESNPTDVVTDETETDVTIKKNHHKIKKPVKTETPVPIVVKEEKPSDELANALSILKSKKKHIGKGSGSGNNGGDGSGTNGGVGDGSGTGHGNGDLGYNGNGGYDLRGRRLMKKPGRMTDSEEEGTVVVEIIVDENGKVIKATPGKRGSTTTSAKLFSKARQAAYEAKFNPSADGVKEQRGTYTFVFTLE